jgi:hypothetical protein
MTCARHSGSEAVVEIDRRRAIRRVSNSAGCMHRACCNSAAAAILPRNQLSPHCACTSNSIDMATYVNVRYSVLPEVQCTSGFKNPPVVVSNQFKCMLQVSCQVATVDLHLSPSGQVCCQVASVMCDCRASILQYVGSRMNPKMWRPKHHVITTHSSNANNQQKPCYL